VRERQRRDINEKAERQIQVGGDEEIPVECERED